MSVDLSIVLSGEFGQWLLRGFLLSIELTLVTLVLAFPLATFVALLRLSPWKPLRGLGFAYVEGIRNVPLLAHLMFWYFGATQLLPEGTRDWLYEHDAETDLRDHRAHALHRRLHGGRRAQRHPLHPQRAARSRRARWASAISDRCASWCCRRRCGSPCRR